MFYKTLVLSFRQYRLRTKHLNALRDTFFTRAPVLHCTWEWGTIDGKSVKKNYKFVNI